MVPSGSGDASDKYEEYIVVLYTDDEGVETKYVERVGSWEVDLSDYSTTEEVNKLAPKPPVYFDVSQELSAQDIPAKPTLVKTPE